MHLSGIKIIQIYFNFQIQNRFLNMNIPFIENGINNRCNSFNENNSINIDLEYEIEKRINIR